MCCGDGSPYVVHGSVEYGMGHSLVDMELITHVLCGLLMSVRCRSFVQPVSECYLSMPFHD